MVHYLTPGYKMFELNEIPLFSALSDEHLKTLYEHIHIKHFNAENILFYEGNQSKYMHILMEGSVKLYKTSPKGTQVEIHRFAAPSLVAEFACFEQVPFPATCEFTTQGTVGLLHYDTFYEYLSHPEFSLGFIKSLTKKVKVLSTLVHKETILSSDAKVADFILREANLFSRLKYNEIASILNLTPETFSRILTKFKKANIIHIEQHELTILNHTLLSHIVETNNLKRTECEGGC